MIEINKDEVQLMIGCLETEMDWQLNEWYYKELLNLHSKLVKKAEETD